MNFGLDKTVPFSHQRETCHWCGNNLNRIRNIYKGKDSERFYCSETCLVKGEDRAIRYRATLAGTVNSPWYVALAVVILALAVCCVGSRKGHAQEHKHHSPYHDFYKEWRQPIPEKTSCCNARFNEKGEEVGDCEATSYFELRKTDNGYQWFAFVPMLNRVIPIPEEKIIGEKNPDMTGREGHVCVNRWTGRVMCAVPPTGVM